jgi:hypothetical protein
MRTAPETLVGLNDLHELTIQQIVDLWFKDSRRWVKCVALVYLLDLFSVVIVWLDTLGQLVIAAILVDFFAEM